MSYEVIYKLKPIKEIEPGWWKLKWRPIFGIDGTWYFWSGGRFDPWRWRVCTWRDVYENGWNRGYKHFYFDVTLAGHTFDFWVQWDFIVHADGPSDVSVKRPLDLSEARLGS